MEHVETAELVDGRADRRLQAVGVGYVGTDRDCLVSSEVSGFLARPCGGEMGLYRATERGDVMTQNDLSS
jgi:hypothetical protein